MDVSSVSSASSGTTGQLTPSRSAAATVAQPVSTTVSTADAGDASANPAPADTITLSPQAQQILASSDTTAQDTDGTATQLAAAATSSDPRADEFYSLAAIVNDTSGKYSQEDQLAAYVKFMAMPANGGWPTNLDDFESTMTQVAESAFGQLVTQLNRQVNSAGAAAFSMDNPNNGPPVAKALLKSFNSLSDFDQKVFFETSVNEQLPVGGSHLSGIPQYVALLESEAGDESANASASSTAAPASAPDATAPDASAAPGADVADSADAAAAAPATPGAAQPVDAKTLIAQSVLKILTDANAARAKQAASDATAKDGKKEWANWNSSPPDASIATAQDAPASPPGG